MTDSRLNPSEIENPEQKIANSMAEYLKAVKSEEYLSVFTVAKDEYEAKHASLVEKMRAWWGRTRSPELEHALEVIKDAMPAKELDSVNTNSDTTPGMFSRVWNYLRGTNEQAELKVDEDFLSKSVQFNIMEDTSQILAFANIKELNFTQITANLLKDGGWEDTSFNTNLIRGLIKKLPDYNETINLDIDAIKKIKDFIVNTLTNSLQQDLSDKEKICENMEETIDLNESNIHQLNVSLVELEESITIELNAKDEIQILKRRIDELEWEKEKTMKNSWRSKMIWMR